jgi:hypothetical protein
MLVLRTVLPMYNGTQGIRRLPGPNRPYEPLSHRSLMRSNSADIKSEA